MRVAPPDSVRRNAASANARSVRPLLSAVVLRSQTDARLVALARDGHDQAFAAIAHRYRRELMAHARRVAPADRAEDIVQQAILSAWSALRRGADVLEVRPWLHRIVANAALRAAQRSDQHAGLSEALAAAPRTDTTVELRLRAREALTALAGLPDPQRRALELTALGDSSGRDAAAALGVSEGGLRKLVHRARASLRSGMAALTPQPLISWSLRGSGSPIAAHATELGAGAGLGAAAIKIGATVAVTASLVGGANQLLSGAHRHRAQTHAHAATRPHTEVLQAGSEGGIARSWAEPSAKSAAGSPSAAGTHPRGSAGSQHGQSGSNSTVSGEEQQGNADQPAGSHASDSGPGQRGAGEPSGAGGAGERGAGEPSGAAGAGGPTAAPESNPGAAEQPGASGQTSERGSAGAHEGGDQGTSPTTGVNQP